MFTRFERKEEFKVIGVEGSPVNGDETPVHRLVENFIQERRGEIKHAVDEVTQLGIAIKPSPEQFVYFFGRPVTEAADVPEGMVARTIPAQEYAVFTHTGDLSDIRQRTFGYIFGTWLAENGYEWTGGPFIEWYGPEYIESGEHVANSKVYIYMPVQTKIVE